MLILKVLFPYPYILCYFCTKKTMVAIQMVDLKRQYAHIKQEVDTAIQNVIDNTAFINGPDVAAFGNELAQYLGVKHVIPCANGTDALQIAMMALGLKPGDEVICPAPYWTTYPEAIALAGGVPVVIDTTQETEFKVTVEQLERAKTPKTKVLLFVSPDNPSGAVYSREETIAIGKWAAANDIWVVTDEIYEHLTYGKHVFTSMPTVVPEIADRCVIVNGVAKTYAMTGWRVGWMIGPPDVMKAAINFQSHTTSNVSNVAQYAALAAVSGDLSAVAMMRESFARRGALMHSMLNQIAGVNCMAPQGAFYCFPDFSGLLNRSLSGVTSATTLELADVILDRAKVAFVPGEAFGLARYARFSFALGDDDLREGINRLASFVNG